MSIRHNKQTSHKNNVFDKVLKLLAQVNRRVDLTHELQTEIDPNVFFRRNSVNLLIGKKGSGKTYNVFRECLKLRFIKDHRYTKMLYITNKPDDPTYTRIAALMPFPVEIVPYSNAVEAISQLSQAKAAMREINDRHIRTSDLEDEAKAELEVILGESITQPHEVYHSIVLLDDCQALFDHRTAANKDLWKLLFENRQPKITYFLTMQDPKGMDTSIKEAVDAVWMFGKYSRYKFGYMLRYIPHEESPEKLWRIYKDLSKNDAILIMNNDEGERVIVINQ